MDARWNLVLADFLINLAAGWFGAIIISPNYSNTKQKVKILILIGDILAVILCSWLAKILRK